VRDFATGQKIINYFKSEDYLSKLRFFQYERPPYTVTKETRSGSPLMIGNKEGFKTELEKIITISQNHGQNTLLVRICYLLGYIEEQIYPVILDSLSL
jgi:hypothetical protein